MTDYKLLLALIILIAVIGVVLIMWATWIIHKHHGHNTKAPTNNMLVLFAFALLFILAFLLGDVYSENNMSALPWLTDDFHTS